jgi:hypothetical protein
MGFHGLTDEEIIKQLEGLEARGALTNANAIQALAKLRNGKQVVLIP